MESKSRNEATLKKMAAREWIWRFVEGYRPDHPTVKKLRQHHKISSDITWFEQAETITDYQQEPGSSAKKRNSEGAQPSTSHENFSSPVPQQPTVAPATQKLTTLASARAEAQSLQRQLHEQSEKHESDLNRAQIEAYQKTKETMDKFRRSYEARIQELTKARPENSPPVFDPYDPEAIPWGRPMGRFKLDHFQIAERQGHSAEYLANVNVISLGGRTGYVPAANCLEIALDTELERIMPSAYLFKPKDDETADEIVCEDWDPRAFHGVQLPQDHEVLCTGETWGEVKERLDKEHDNAQSTISTLSPGCCSVRPMPTMTVANTKVPGIERETFSKMEESSKARSLQICGVKRLGHHLIAESQLLFRAAAIKNDKGLRALSQADEAQTILRGEEEACLVRMMEKLTILDE